MGKLISKQVVSIFAERKKEVFNSAKILGGVFFIFPQGNRTLIGGEDRSKRMIFFSAEGLSCPVVDRSEMSRSDHGKRSSINGAKRSCCYSRGLKNKTE